MNNLILEGMPIIFKNFAGAEGPYNDPGERNFCVLIEDPDLATSLLDEGWRIRPLTDDDGEVTAHYLPVKLNFGGLRPGRVYRVFDDDRPVQPITTEFELAMFDTLPVEWVDIRINPYQWSVSGQSGVKAYVNTVWIMVEEDKLDRKWALVHNRDE